MDIPEYKPTIMIVDDQIENSKLLLAYLHNFGFNVLIATSGEEALRQLEQTTPDVLLLDVLMPGMNGFETCRRVKQNDKTRNIPVIFMTALSDTVEKLKGFDIGGVDYITKPFECEEVLARINTHHTNRKLQQQLQEERARFQTLSGATFEGIIIHEDGRILDVNQAIIQMSGYQRSELIGQPILELLAAEDRQFGAEQIRLKREQPYEATGITKDGAALPIEIQGKTIPYQGRNVRVVAIRDITWRKSMEQEQAQLRKENITLRSTIRDRYKFGEIIGKSPVMQEVYQSIVRAAASDANVVVSGESGTGKELVARTIHQMSDRNHQGFVAVNCGAVPETLFEREFFGHRKGAFTGATTDKPGYFDQAHGGTLFLDEVGELSPALQVKLLRVLQEREYIPLGDTVSRKVDVRIIAATNKNLREQLHKGLIREDFFYRIRVIVVHLPPLRTRAEDIPLLIDHFQEHYGDGKESALAIPPRIMDALCSYHWPGNVRELQNELQRYLAEQRLEFFEMRDESAIETDIMADVSARGNFSLYNALESFEKQFLITIFEKHNQNRKDTAAALGIDRKTLYTKLKKYEVI